MNRITKYVALIAALTFGATDAPGQPRNVVYESLTAPAGGGYAFNLGEFVEIGHSIALAGTARNVTQIDLYLGDNTSDLFRVRLYNLDEISGRPSTLIWESPAIQYPNTPPFYNRKIISVPVPGILVPDTLAWTVAPVDPSSSGNLSVLTGSLFPSVGSHLSYWGRRPDLSWRSNLFSNGSFGARLFAVPEPSAVWIMAIGAFMAIATRRP